MSDQEWRVGRHYGIHVYEGDRPVATFHDPDEAAAAVAAVNAFREKHPPVDNSQRGGSTERITDPYGRDFRG